MALEIKLRDLYSKLLSVFELDAVSSELLSKVAAGSEKAEDYETICRSDKFLTATICSAASAHMKMSVVSSFPTSSPTNKILVFLFVA